MFFSNSTNKKKKHDFFTNIDSEMSSNLSFVKLSHFELKW